MSRARDLASNVTALGALDYGDTLTSGRHLFAIWHLYRGDAATAAALMLAALVICGAGVWRRS